MIPLVTIAGANFNKLNPQARSYFEEIATKLGILVNQPTKIDQIEVFSGSFESFFKSYPKDFMLTKMAWDGKEGLILFLTSMGLAIEASGFMMGFPANTVKEKVAKVQFDGEVEEAFGEVSNQLWGNINQCLIGKIDKNIRLSLKTTCKLPQDGSKNSEVDDLFYVILKCQVHMSDVDPQPLYLLISHLLAKDIFDVLLEPPQIDKETVFNKLTQDLDAVTAEQVMMKDYPTIDINKSLSDAYQCMIDHKVDALPLIQAGKVIRVITKNNLEIIKSVFFDAPGQEERNRKILQFPLMRVSANQKLISVGPQDLVGSIVKKMYETHIHTMPVVNADSQLLGMIFSLDLLRKILG
ncbi:MAG: CBS domain-containing protein [Deltaproteobacteria bacterium]|nr:MAG: CBS domain-containing protein [Deltaproteobacteria bacterium]